MKRFVDYEMEINEMKTDLLRDLDRDYIRKALSIRSIDIKGTDFNSDTRKKEIQFMLATQWFPKFPMDMIQDTMTTRSKNKINRAIDYLRNNYYTNFMRLWNFPAAGIGPGEAMLYFLINKAIVGGGGSAGVDIMILNGKKYELKAATISATTPKVAAGFRLGGTVQVSDFVRQVVQFKRTMGLKFGGSGEEEVNKGDLVLIRKKYPAEMKRLEAQFQTKAHQYLAKNDLVLFNNNRVGAKVKDEETRGNLKRDVGGRIEFIGKVSKSQVRLAQISQGKPKPEVTL